MPRQLLTANAFLIATV